MSQGILCEQCLYHEYDEEYEEYCCTMSMMDQDDYGHVVSDGYMKCPFYRMGDEYVIVNKQI